MVLVTFTTTVAATREAAFAYMSDWSTIAQWDPNTRGSTKTTPGAVGVGTKYDITTVFKGKESPMTYEIVSFEPPSKVVLVGESATATAQDSIVIKPGPSAEQATIEYTADIRLKGWLSCFTFLVAGDIRALGVDARLGVERAFAEGRHKQK